MQVKSPTVGICRPDLQVIIRIMVLTAHVFLEQTLCADASYGTRSLSGRSQCLQFNWGSFATHLMIYAFPSLGMADNLFKLPPIVFGQLPFVVNPPACLCDGYLRF
jgi:hypothetical protein